MPASIESVHAVDKKSFSELPPSFTALGRLCQDLDDVAGSFEMYQQCRQAWKAPVLPEIRSSSYIGALFIVEGSNTGGAPGVQKGTKGYQDTLPDCLNCWHHPCPYMIYHVLDASYSTPLYSPPHLIKPDLLPTNQTFLQCTPDPHGLNRTLQLHRQLPAIQTDGHKFIRFPNERVFKPLIIRRRELPPHSPLLIDIHQIHLRLHVDGQFALGPDNLGRIFLPGGHHPAREEIGDFPSIKLHDPHGIVPVAPFPQSRLHGRDAVGDDGFDFAVLAEEPEGEVDVVDAAVDEDAARVLGVGDEEARRVEFVAGLGAEDGGGADQAGGCFGMRVAVGVVEAAGEATHDF